MRLRISFAKVMMTPPARVRKPLALCDGSCDLSERPICTTPKPVRISPTALISPKIKVERLLIAVSALPPLSSAANAVTVKQHTASTVAITIIQ